MLKFLRTVKNLRQQLAEETARRKGLEDRVRALESTLEELKWGVVMVNPEGDGINVYGPFSETRAVGFIGNHPMHGLLVKLKEEPYS